MKVQLLLGAVLLFSVALASPSASEDEEKEFTDDELTDDQFDEAVFMGDDRKSLKDLSKEEAAEEVREMVALMDRDGDGQLDKEELIAYQIRLTEHNNNKMTNQVFEKHDENGDGLASFAEVWVHGEEGDPPEEGVELDEHQQSLKTKFDSADANGDGSLDKEEFGSFVHPHRHDHMVEHLVRDQLNTYDKDGNGEISRKEYLKSFNPDDLPEEDLPEWVGDEKANFDYNLDLDQNGRLNNEEIRRWMVPDDATLFNVEAHHLFYSADTNRDRKLTVEEIQERFDVFTDSSITNNGFAVHEEL